MLERRIRPLAICVFSHQGRILVDDAGDPVRRQRYYRPLGGGIEFGERSHETISREIREEIGQEVASLRYLGTIENLFQYLGEPGHEIVQVYDGEFVDRAVYRLDSIEHKDGDGPKASVVWRGQADFTSEHPLYPDGLLALLLEAGVLSASGR